MGERALQSGKLAMLNLGPWGMHQIHAWAPETAGKWRATRIPFGMHAWDGSDILSIPLQSQNKEMAWKFIEFSATENMVSPNHYDSIPAYTPARKHPTNLQRTSEFLGGQQAYALFEELADKISPYRVTPLDEQVYQIWVTHVASGIEGNLDPDDIVKNIEVELERQLGEERNILRQQLTD